MFTDFKGLIQFLISQFINPIIGLLMALGVVYFMWGVAEFIRNAESPDKRKEGQMKMLYGIIGLAVMGSMWGLVAILTNTFGFGSALPLLPTGGR